MGLIPDEDCEKIVKNAKFSVERIEEIEACLLYTSDAADERSSVDLGGRRIIKKKTTEQLCSATAIQTTPEK